MHFLCPAAGRLLNEDLAQLWYKHERDHLLLEAAFPSSYPDAPFTLRVVQPRCVWYTGTGFSALGTACDSKLQSGLQMHAMLPATTFPCKPPTKQPKQLADEGTLRSSSIFQHNIACRPRQAHIHWEI